jgi:hypothetical protein
MDVNSERRGIGPSAGANSRLRRLRQFVRTALVSVCGRSHCQFAATASVRDNLSARATQVLAA